MTAVMIIHTSGVVEQREFDITLGTLQGIVGGYIEAFVGNGWVGYCDEEGKLKGKPVNLKATQVAHAGGWPRGDYLVGDIIFLGPERGEHHTDVPAGLVALATPHT